MGGWIEPLLKALLPWFFSGSEKNTSDNTQGLPSADRKPGQADKKLRPEDLPKLLLAFGLALALSGCVFGGTNVVHKYHSVEPGDVVEVVDGKVKVKDPKKPDEVGSYDPIGKVLLPKSVYADMREAWLEKHKPDPDR